MSPASPSRHSSSGQRLLSAVERLVDDSDALIGVVEARRAALRDERGRGASRRAVARQLIADYSSRSALTGALAAAPGLVPGVGSVLAIVGGSLVDVALMLKHEVELVLCLSYLYGNDIRDEKERWLAYVLAGVRVYEVESGRNYFVDVAEAEFAALPRYAPRQLFKVASTAFARIALNSASKAVVRAVPLLGVVVSASTNKLMTASVGWWCVAALEQRRRTQRGPDSVLEAVVQ